VVLVAHAGHWLPTLIFWIGPVLVIAAILLIQKLPGYDPDAEPPPVGPLRRRLLGHRASGQGES